MQRIEIGRERLLTALPIYGAFVLDHYPEPKRSDFLMRLGYTEPGKTTTYPKPSELFGLAPSWDARLITDGRDKDVTLCTTLATIPAADQREFYQRYAKDPEQAEHWRRLERYKRPLLAHDQQDDYIWRLFTMLRLDIEYRAATDPRCTLAGLGRSLVQQAGFLDAIVDRRRLVSVLASYGSMLAHGEDVGDAAQAPWAAH